MVPARRRSALVGAIVVASLVLAGCAGDAELDTLEPQSPDARSIDDLLDFVLIIAGLVGLFVLGGIVYMAVRNRVSDYDPDDELPNQIHGNTRLELLWTAVPAAILAVVAVFTVAALADLNDTEANAYPVELDGESTMWEPTVVVVGQQWWWEYRYYIDEPVTLAEFRESADPRDLPPADIVTAGQMVIPAGQEVELIVTSRDVIHSHWIPALNGKRDTVPGRFAPWKLEADDPGVYFGQCTEYCGLSHSVMRMQVIALSDAEFQAWLTASAADAEAPSAAAAEWLTAWRAGEAADAPSTTAEERGLVAFTQQCTSCHLIEGVNDHNYDGAAQVSRAAPNLTHFASRTTFMGGVLPLYLPDGSLNRVDLEEWLRNPTELKEMAADDNRGMPDLNLPEETIDDLVAYLATLGPRPSGEVIAATDVE